MPMESLECMETEGNPAIADISAMSPESCIMQEDEKRRKLHVWISDGEDRLVFDKATPKETLKLPGVSKQVMLMLAMIPNMSIFTNRAFTFQ